MYLNQVTFTQRCGIVLNKADHPAWIGFQHFLVRSVIALKFLIMGRLLGPEAIGLIGIALLTLAVCESLSDTGLPQAIVQRGEISGNYELGSVWTLLCARGFILAVVLYLSSDLIAAVLRVPLSAPLIALACGIPLMRNSLDPGYYMHQRRRNFRGLAVLESGSVILDFIISVYSAFAGLGPMSVIVGSLAGEAARLIGTRIFLHVPHNINFAWRSIGQYAAYGRWIWATSVLTLFLTQFDKYLVTSLFGPTQFGLYQMAYKLAQLTMADAAHAAAQYLFPTFAEVHRQNSSQAATFFSRVLLITTILVAAVGLSVVLAAPYIIPVLLGSEWTPMIPVFNILVLTLGLGAVMVIIVAYARGIGHPRLVTHATLLQLILLTPSATFMAVYFGILGMAGTTAACIAIAIIYILLQIKTLNRVASQ